VVRLVKVSEEMIIRDILRRLVRRLGIESSALILTLKRFYPRQSAMRRLARMLACYKVSVVLDVGANVGQFASELRLSGYRGRIISFEPILRAHRRLIRKAAGDPNWTVASRMAIGNCNGNVNLHVAGDSVSSSVLEMLDVLVAAAPDSIYVEDESVPMHTLDSVEAEYVKEQDVLFLKADVQGYESEVLEGAQKLLPRVAGMHLELALVPCYKGQPAFSEVMKRLASWGFSLWSLSEGTMDEETGRQLQVDAVFFRGD